MGQLIRIFLSLFMLLVIGGAALSSEAIEQISIDASALNNGQRINLNGQWGFIFNEHVPIKDIAKRLDQLAVGSIRVPGSWNDEVAKLTDSIYQHGRATYAVPIKLNGQLSDPISLHTSFIAGAHQIYWVPKGADQPVLIAQSGDWQGGTYTGLKDQSYHFPSFSMGYLVIHVYKKTMHAGGIRQPISLQRSDILEREIRQNLILRSLLSGGLLIMIFHYLVQYFYSRENLTTLLLSFVCFSALLRGVSTAGLLEIFIQSYSTKHYEISIKAEYLSVLYMSISYFIFLCYLMPKMVPKVFVQLALASAAIGTLATVIMPAPMVSSLLDYYLAYLGFWCLAALVVILIGIKQKRRFAWLVMISAFILGAGGINDVIASKSALHNIYVVEYVFFIFLFFQAQLVGLQLKESREASVLLKEEKLLLQQAHSKAKMESHLDFLTGLSNRLALTEWIKEYELDDGTLPNVASVIMFDIDHFKLVNDTYGHDVGDEIIVFVASLIHGHSLRASDFKCRFGGEEFLVMLPGAGLKKAKEVAESLRHALEDAIAFSKGDIEIKITASFGVAEYSRASQQTLSDSISSADEALYRAKNSGRNCVSV